MVKKIFCVEYMWEKYCDKYYNVQEEVQGIKNWGGKKIDG